MPKEPVNPDLSKNISALIAQKVANPIIKIFKPYSKKILQALKEEGIAKSVSEVKEKLYFCFKELLQCNEDFTLNDGRVVFTANRANPELMDWFAGHDMAKELFVQIKNEVNLNKPNDYVSRTILANFYSDGIGVDKDLGKAFELFQEAAEKGYAPAQTSLAVCYMSGQGTGTQKDPEQAIVHFKKAADQGFSPAMYSLGFCYEKGKGVDVNMDFAVKHLMEAFDKGPEMVRERVENSVKRGSSAAQCALGIVYAEGRENIKQDAVQAFKHLGSALANGSMPICEVLENYATAASNKIGSKIAEYALGAYYVGREGSSNQDVRKGYDYLFQSRDSGLDLDVLHEEARRPSVAVQTVSDKGGNQSVQSTGVVR